MPRPRILPLAACATLCSPGFGFAQEDVEPRNAEARPGLGVTDDNSESDRDQLLRLMREFADTFEQIERNYVTEIDREALMEAAIDGMVARLDPYSTYLDDEEVGRFRREVGGGFSGIGVQIFTDPETGRLTVTAPFPGGPAAEAGVRAGDVIVSVDGNTADRLDSNEITARIKGPAGEPVTLGLLRPGQEEVEEVTVTRADVRIPTVLGDARRADGTWDFALPGDVKVGLLRVTRFAAGTNRELTKALVALKEAGATGVILDLRGDPGGLLNQAVAVTDLFLKEGRIVSTAGRNVAPQQFEALPGGVAEDLNVVVLVDRFSASASEIVAAALQDAGRATIIGERTWGKGSVQTVIDLGGGRTALKITTAAYLRPSGANIQRPTPAQKRDQADDSEWGVTPDEGFRIPLSPQQRREVGIARAVRDRPANVEVSAETLKLTEVEDPHVAAALKVLAGERGALAP